MAAKNYTEILALVNAGNQMGLSNTIKRDYGIPLDFTSVQETYDAAVIYAAENTKAYVGQPLSVGGKLYIINDVAAETKYVIGEKEYDNYLVEVGSATEGDGATIDLENGVLTLHGFEGALSGYLPRKAEDGTLEWVPISAVVQGDGNKVTTLTSTNGSVTIEKSTDTDESLVYDLSVEVYDDTALSNRVKAIEDDYLKEADKYDDTELTNRVKALEDDKVDKDAFDELSSTVSAFLTGDGTEAALDSLKELIAYINSHDDVDIAGILEDIQAIEGKLAGIDSTVVAYVTDAIDALKIGDYAKAADLTALADRVAVLEAKPFDTYAIKSEVEADLAKKIETGSIAHSSDTLAEGVTVEGTKLNIVVDAYTKQEVRDYVADVIEDMTGGESAADVLLALNNHIATYEEKVGQIDTKNSEQDTAIAAAQTQADKGVADAAKVASDLASLRVTVEDNTREIGVAKESIASVNSTLSSKIAALEVKDTDTDGAIAGLTTIVEGHTGSITAINAGIATLTSKDTELAAAIQANTDKFGNYTTTEQLNALLGGKADASAVYTKGEVDNLLANLDQREIKADIQANADAIAILVGEDTDKSIRTIAAEEINALIDAANNEDTITNINSLINYVNENAGDIAQLTASVADNTGKLAGIESTVVAYVDSKVAAVKTPKGSDEIDVSLNGTISISQVNVNKLVQSDDEEFIIDGGHA